MTTANQSESIGKLAEALAKAQATMLEAKEDCKNPFFKSNYADLTSVWRACKDSLTSNGIAISQPTVMVENQLYVSTMMIHTSGEWIRGMYPVVSTKNDPQSIGSATTYARRYALAAMVGVCKEGEDDDAEQAMPRKEVITDAQLKELIAAVGSDMEAKDIILKRFSVKAFNEIPKDSYVTMMVWLEKRKKENAHGKTSVA